MFFHRVFSCWVLFLLAPLSVLASDFQALNVNAVLRNDAQTSAYINWRTERTTSSRIPQPQTTVIFAPQGTPLVPGFAQTVYANIVEYDRVGYHSAELIGLHPGTVYQYAILDTQTQAMSKVRQLTTAPMNAETFSFIAAADTHYRTTSIYQNFGGETLRAAVTRFPDTAFIVHTGTFASSENLVRYDGFFGMTQDTLSQYPIVPLPVASGSTNRFFHYSFNVPGTGADTDNYAVSYGNAMILALNTNRTSTANIEQHIQWLRAQAAQARAENKWLIVAMNNSFYGARLNTTTIKRRLEQTFEEEGVSLVIQGKDNAYVRSYLISNAVEQDEYPSDSSFATKDGVLYLTPGSAGNEYAAISSSAKWVNVNKDYSSSSERKVAGKKAYANITVTADTLQVDVYTVDSVNPIDSFEFHRGETPAIEPRHLEPHGLNNAFIGNAKTNRNFTWQTITPAMMKDAFVEFYDLNGNHLFTEYGTSRKMTEYTTSNYIHKVSTNRLAPTTTYQYRVGNLWSSSKSGITYTYYSDYYTFETDFERPFSFIHVADSQGGSSSYQKYWGNTLERALAYAPDAAFVIHTGDMIETSSTSHWNGWFDAVGTNLATPAFFPVLGNHEGTSSTTIRYTESVFNVPSDNDFALNYAHSYGNVLFFHLNSNYTTKAQLEKQASWMRQKVAMEGNGKFIVVSFHKAPFGGRHATDGDVEYQTLSGAGAGRIGC
jgi:Calcineurin-like phosphoesterase.